MEEINGMKVYTLAEIPEPDTSYFLPWTLSIIYEVEPSLKDIAEEAIKQKRRRFPARLKAYFEAKRKADGLVGWSARDPRLRDTHAWDCYFGHILDELRV